MFVRIYVYVNFAYMKRKKRVSGTRRVRNLGEEKGADLFWVMPEASVSARISPPEPYQCSVEVLLPTPGPFVPGLFGLQTNIQAVGGYGIPPFKKRRVGHPPTVGIGALGAEGDEVGVVADGSVVLRDHARTPQEVLDIVLRVGPGGQQGNAATAEEDVLGGGGSRGVGLGEDFASGTVPVEFAAYLGGAASVGVVGVGDAASSLQLALGVPGVGIHESPTFVHQLLYV